MDYGGEGNMVPGGEKWSLGILQKGLFIHLCKTGTIGKGRAGAVVCFCAQDRA